MIAIGVVAHQQRAMTAENLKDAVGAVLVNTDDGTLTCEGNHLVVLGGLYQRCRAADWLVVLEDDALPVPGFGEHLAAALAHAPAPIVGLYLGTGNPSGPAQRAIKVAVDKAKASNRAWLLADCLIGSVGYAIRREVFTDMFGFITGRYEELPLRISRWAQDRGVDICYTQPSLVNHADEEPIGRPWQGPHRLARRAWNYGTRGHYNTGAVRIGYCPVWSAPQ